MPTSGPRAPLPSDLQALVARASRRMFLSDLIVRAAWCFAGGFAALALLSIVWKLGPWMAGPLGVSFGPILLAVLGVSAVASVAWTAARAPRGAALVEAVDRRVGLRERRSTAYVLAGANEGWASAVTRDASASARRVVIPDSIPVSVEPRVARPPLISLGVFVLAFLAMPRYDLTGALAALEEDRRQAEEAERVAIEIEAQEKRLEEILSETGIDVLDEEGEEGEDAEPQARPRTPEDVRRNQIRKLTRVSEELEQAGEGEQAKTVEAMREAMRRLKAPPPGPLMEFQRQLARGNFGEAKAALEQLADKMERGDLTERQRRELADQTARLGEQLAELSEQRESLERALRQAGMSESQAEQAARDPNALDRMLEQMPSIPAPEQLALRQAAQAQQNASQAMESMAQAAQQMAESTQQSGENQSGTQAGGGASQMSESLAAMDAMASEQEAASQALAEARAQLQSLGESMAEGGRGMGSEDSAGGPGGQGEWAQGDSRREGEGGGGGPGRGQGGSMDDRATDFVLKDERANVNTGEGPIIASTLVFGSQLRGESRATFGAATSRASAESAEAIETMRVPREFHDAVRAYFGRLERAAEADAEADAAGAEGSGERNGDGGVSPAAGPE